MIINPEHPLFNTLGGLHQLYANTPAAQGYRDNTVTAGAHYCPAIQESSDLTVIQAYAGMTNTY